MKVNNKKMVFFISGAVVIAAVAGIGLWRNATKTVSGNVNQEKTYSVKVMDVANTENDVFLQYTGMIQPQGMEQVTFENIGKIEKIYVKEGDSVKKGQALAKMQDDNVKRQQDAAYQSMKAAEAGKNSAKTALDAAQKAYDNVANNSNMQDLTTAKNNLEQAKSKKDAAQNKVNLLTEESKSLEAQVAQAQNALTHAQENTGLAQVALDQAQAEQPQDPDKITAAQDSLTAAQLAQQVAQTEVDQAQSALSAKQAEKTQAEIELQVANAEVVKTQGEYDRLSGQNSSVESTLKSQLETARYSYESASATYENAKSTYEMAVQQTESCVYKAESDGTVIKIVGTEGGIATPLAPVLVVGSKEMTVQFGVSQSDVKEIKENYAAKINLNGEEYAGYIKEIAVIPDEQTRTYLTTVAIKNSPSDLYLGEIASVQISLGQQNGIWLPLSVILNDGQDYVYLVENNRATRKNVTITDINNDKVRVQGLEFGGQIITQGMKTVKTGNLVSVIEE